MASDIPYSDGSQPSLVSVEAYRQLVDRVNVLSKMLVKDGELKVADGNAVLTINFPDSAGAGGIPTGYVETSVTLCTDSGDVPGKILFNPD